ncbi:histidine phosphatase family protein [Vagococcus coleopterorum]|uniref:Histidine phosphatase family protein n=1 Tax=Vagococcus coleopterorum TaxID=2714946 RepID=A0A6G8APT6_9ENTE|nr:histidine phosphatase family protein [Vagococcus coleopterorum]QIL47016.1 histidine phosphatase family protein [Vagococcus coleopterorum]
MKTLYLMRHGQTLFNQLHKIQGWCDAPLTPLGIEQARVASSYFKEHQITLKSAYASTSERASDTLELVTDLPYKRLKGLKEWNFGRFEGEPEFLNPKLPYGDFFAAFDGEKENDFKKRINNTLLKIMTEDPNDSILVVSHGAACAQFMRNWQHLSQIETPKGIKNCCIMKFEYVDEQFKLFEVINHDFSQLENTHI